MFDNHKIAVILPAYNAAKTLKRTVEEIPFDIVDEVILVDDCSFDNTIEIAKQLGIKHIIKHDKNKGYGANQKTCYDTALKLNCDIVVMLHPDYQYSPKLIKALVAMITSGHYDVVLASRILGKGALKGGMPLYKYIFNRILTYLQNAIMKQKFSEYHTGYRAFKSDVLRKVNYKANSDDFVFDNQMIAQICYHNFRVAEISCPTRYFKEASSINFKRSIKYGLGVILTSLQYRLQKWKIKKFKIFEANVDR
ncbi:MAG: glycosyltransferase family 2 protein [Bacteroidales bacterium]|nr:glycosyltransferase family 2 protein [Bacteroidales bacterium]